MSQLLGTLSSLLLYVGLVAAGAVIGSRRAVRSRPLAWLGRVQFLALMVLIAALGVQLGANEQVVKSIGQIGLSALCLSLAAMGGSLLCVTLLRRFVLGLDRQGLPRGTASGEDAPARSAGKADNALTKWIVAAVLLGMLAGRFLLPEAVTARCGTAISLGLYVLLFLVGLDMGRQGTMLSDIRAAGLKVLLVPLAVAVGTLGAAALVGLLLPLPVRDAMAAAAGFGWYSLAPTLLAPYSLTLSAVAFLANVMREIFSIVAIPFVAKHVGYIECAGLPGAAAMDTVLPVVVGATHERVTIYSFASGVILSLAVPILVPTLIAL